VALYFLMLIALGVSFARERRKTLTALRKGWKTFTGILPSFASVLLLTSAAVALTPPHILTGLLGERSGLAGDLLASVIGSVTLIPGFVAFPLAKTLIDAGAGYAQMGVFVSTLMMVGIVTLPMEKDVFGWRVALGRNGLAYLFSLLVGLAIGWVMR